MSSSSSGSCSESKSLPVPTRKRKQVEGDSPDSFEDASCADSDEDTLQPVTESTVLSHAERRRQKKKQQLAAASLETPHKKRKLTDGTDVKSNSTTKTWIKIKTMPTADDPRRQKRENSVWVGNLSFRTTQDTLRGFFDGVGTITRIHMPMRRGKETQGENMGFAYVDFDTPDAKVIAITLSEGQLDGRNLLIKDGDDFTGRPARAKTDASEAGGESAQDGEKSIKKSPGTTTGGEKGLSKTAQRILRAQKQPPAPTLFLGNLGFETTEIAIRELFEAHRHCKKGRGKGGEEHEAGKGDGGEDERKDKSNDVWIRKIRMGTFEDSGNCKGFAFVDFTSIEHATVALVNPRNHHLNGRDLVVEYASSDAVRRGGGGPRKTKEDRSAKNAQKGSSANAPRTRQCPPHHSQQEDDVIADVATEAAMATTMRSRRPDRTDRSHTRRTKPGAALAQAQRQSAAILPSQGQKIVF